MCTVTFLPLKKGEFVLISNRDIPFSRAKAELPKHTVEDGVSICFPKDGKAGGSWIGTSDKKRLICLLNGGFEYHTSLSNYKKSRGQIVKDLLKVDDLKDGLDKIDLDGVEQFTLVIVEWSSEIMLFEFVWDGSQKHYKKLQQTPQIWSSSTLYDPSIKKLRENWFDNWFINRELSGDSLLEFHQNAGIGDPFIDLIMDRVVGGTVSISRIQLKNDKITFSYKDVTNGEKNELIY